MKQMQQNIHESIMMKYRKRLVLNGIRIVGLSSM